MSGDRRDSKNRILRNGEVQRSDGKYMFRYTDASGRRCTVYSWRLVSTDEVPKGKQCGASLRELERSVLRDRDDGIETYNADRMSVNDLFDEFMDIRVDLRQTTRSKYICLYNAHIRNDFGTRMVSSVKPTDIKRLYINLAKKENLGRATLDAINTILLQMFRSAAMDNLVRVNPVLGVLPSLKNLAQEGRKREALTEPQQEAFVNYIYAHKKYKDLAPLFTVLLGTGMRIGEALGLCWHSCDFEHNCIIVDHTIVYRPDENGSYRYWISEPKTRAGKRTIPMFSEVREAIIKEHDRAVRKGTKKFSVDGVSDFIFLNRNGKVYTPSFVYDVIQNIVTNYNREEAFAAKREHREAILIPKISAHILRHTFCTRLCENKCDIQDLNVIKDVMGHKNIRTTMDIYNSVTEKRKQENFQGIEGRFKLT